MFLSVGEDDDVLIVVGVGERSCLRSANRTSEVGMPFQVATEERSAAVGSLSAVMMGVPPVLVMPAAV